MYAETLSWSAAIAALAMLAGPATAQEENAVEPMECLTVELIMYSGRPRPQFLICTEAEKREVLTRLDGLHEEKPAETAYPKIESDPSYQGLLLTLPGPQGAGPTRVTLRKGFLKRGGSILMDRGRSLEKYFLNRSLEETDRAESPFKGSPLRRLTGRILADIEREPAAK